MSSQFRAAPRKKMIRIGPHRRPHATWNMLAANSFADLATARAANCRLSRWPSLRTRLHVHVDDKTNGFIP